jgi:two-component system, NtrC family, sensor histidine kinase HydH
LEYMRILSPFVLRISLALLVVLSSAAVLYTTVRNTRSAASLADQALESTALALSSSAETALRAGVSASGEEISEIFSDRVVAYALIAGQDGSILFHTNPRLVGARLGKEDSEASWPAKTASGRRTTLGTGVPAYEFNYVLHRPDGTPELLRLVLQTTPADRIVLESLRMWWTVGGVLALLWTVGIISERIFSRYLRLQEESERRGQLALIGQMTAVLAHEIRNALGSIKGYAQWVDEKIRPDDLKKPGLTGILQGTGRIESLVNELLLFSREEKFQPEHVHVEPLVREVTEAVVPPWNGRLDLDVEGEIKAWADREKLYRVISNGVRNAVQSMGGEGVLRVSARADGRRVTIQVEDTGPGIPESEIPLLFTPFHTSKPDGTGLGLAYSKKAVEGMGGRILLKNREGGRGAVLSIQLRRV